LGTFPFLLQLQKPLRNQVTIPCQNLRCYTLKPKSFPRVRWGTYLCTVSLLGGWLRVGVVIFDSQLSMFSKWSYVVLVLCNSLFDNLDLETLKCLFLQVMFHSDTCCIFIFNEINLFLLPCPLIVVSPTSCWASWMQWFLLEVLANNEEG